MVAPALLHRVPGVVLGVLCVFAELNAQGNQSSTSKDFFPAPHFSAIKNSSRQANFILDSTYNTGSGPHFIGIGDWNGDGKLDLAIPHSISNEVHTWLNLGSGIFSRNNVIPVGTLPRILTAGDFDADGDLDLAVANEASNSVTMVNNDGQGNFLVQGLPILLGGEPSHISSGDINRDGLEDLVIALHDASTILVLINGGDGSFDTQIPYRVNRRPTDLFLGDFDNDGFLDIVVSNSVDNTVSLFINDKNGSFAAPRTFALGIEPDFVLGQDFNGDDRLDLAVANRLSNTISILFNQGASFSVAKDYPVGSDPLAIATGDWDGDLDSDLAVVNHQSEDLYIFSNDGAGQFQTEAIYVTGARPRFVSSGDFDGDGDLDLAVANWGADNFQIFSNQRLPIPNRAPDTPQLFFPNNRAFVNPTLAELRLSWSVPADQDGDSLHFRVEIDQSPDFASPDLRFESKDAATGFSPAPPVGQGIDTVYFNIAAPLPDSLYWWRVTAWDGAVYGDPSPSKNFVIDASPPKLDDFLLTNPIFAPNWYNPARLSSINFGVQYDEKYARQAEFDLGVLGGVRSLQNITSGFDQMATVPVELTGAADGLYPLTVVLFDSAGNTATGSRSIALDSTPPTGTLASSPDSSAQEKFVVAWGETATDGAGAGISGKYDVRVQIDGGAWQDWLTDFAGNLAEYQGSHGHRFGFEAVARDNVGNIEAFAQIAETVTMVDTSFADQTSPSIVHSSVAIVEEGENVNIQAQIQDDLRVDAAHLFYKQSGKRSYQTMPMTELGGGIYQATLTSATISTKGVNYYIQASDGLHFSYHPRENWDTTPHNISVRIRGANNQGLMKDDPQPGGNAQSAFRMISSPLILEDSRPQAVFEDDLGAYDPKQWRLFRFNSLAGDYAEFPNLESFSSGKAFWLIVRSPNKQIDSGIGTTVATNQPFQIALQQGWNDISNPFTFPVNWGDVQIIQGTSAEIMGPYTYRGQWLLPNQVTTLSAWEGYAVYSVIPSAIISISPIEAVAPPGPTLAKNDDKMDWRIGCAAVCEEALDGANSLGVSSNASAEWDELDFLEPPPIGDYVSLRFPHHDWQKFRGTFSTDFRPPFADGQVWHFEVATNIANAPITLKFQNVESLPAEFQAILRDLKTLVQINIQQDPEYVFVPDQSRLSREFELIVGTAGYIEDSDQQKQATPKTFSLGQNFPNPFNAGTTLLYQVAEPSHVSIKVFNIYGQEIRRLMTQPQNPGRYQVRWDAKSDDAREMGSGIYFIQLEAGPFRQIRKVLLVR